MAFFLKHVEGSKNGQVESFDRDIIRIGRQSDNDLAFDPQKDASVSGYHAEISREGESYFLRDLQSRNGTFVNSRKIESPIQLEDGDLVQFSGRGPKIVFTTRDPSLPNQTAFTEPSRSAPTEILSKPTNDTEQKPASKSGLLAKLVVIGVWISSSAAAFAVGFYLNYPWWASLAAVASVSLLIAGVYLGWRFWRHRRTRRQEAEAAHQEREASLGRGRKDNLEDLKHKWTEVVRSLRQSKHQKTGDDALDALPWVALIGEPGSGKSALIKRGGPQSSVLTRGSEGPTQNCDWWFFDKLVVLDLAGRYLYQGKESETAVEWQELLNLLKSNRRREPINGVIVAIAADSLASVPVEKLKEQAAHTRERLDDISQRLGIKFPVYLTVTKCDLIVGFNEFWNGLPDKTNAQAAGEVNADPIHNSDAGRFFDKAFHRICERVERIRLAQIVEDQQETALQRMFLFPAELKSLQVPLKSFVEVLFRPSSYRDAPFLRGFFLTSGRQSGSPTSRLSRLLGYKYSHPEAASTNRDFFLRDLYSTILPSDRHLATRTAVGREHHRLRWAAGLIGVLAVSLLVCIVFTISFTNNWMTLTHLDVTPCTNLAALRGSIGDALRPLDNCRQNISSLHSQSEWKRLASNFGLRQTPRLVTALQQRYLPAFRTSVINPLENRIDQALAKGSGASMVVGAITQRALLMGKCEQNGWCGDLHSANPLSYRVMLSIADPELKGGDVEIERLRRTHESFLLWQSNPNEFAETRLKDVQRIKDWLARGHLKEESVIESARAQFNPVRASSFWGLGVPLEVDAAYTARAWQEGIEPLISGLKKLAADQAEVNESVKRFEANYRGRALRQWGEFLSEFSQPEKVPIHHQMNRELVNVISGADSPYIKVIDDANANLSVILGDAWARNELPAWASTLKQFAALKAKVTQAQKSAKSNEKPAGGETEAGGYLTVYLEAVGQLRGELTTFEKSFKSAQKAFEEGEATAKATHPILRATWALSMLRSSIGAPEETDRLFWMLLSRPLWLAWRGMLTESGKYLQQQWEGLLLEIRDFDPGSKGSKIMNFVNQSAGAFLTRQGGRWVSRRLLDQSFPFTDGFVQYLSRLRFDAMNPTTFRVEPPFTIVRSS
jgi:type VI secretion system protein ImpL